MYAWAHVYSSFRGQWLPGDQRGFNARHHKIHSTRNYLITDPSTKEHKALEEYSEDLRKRRVIVGYEFMPAIQRALVEKFKAMGVEVAAVACHFTHAHALIKVGDLDAKLVFGRAKQFASHSVRGRLPGRIWGQSSGVRRVSSFRHSSWVLWYITDHEDKGASVWFDTEMEKRCAAKYGHLRVENPYVIDWTKSEPW